MNFEQVEDADSTFWYSSCVLRSRNDGLENCLRCRVFARYFQTITTVMRGSCLNAYPSVRNDTSVVVAHMKLKPKASVPPSFHLSLNNYARDRVAPYGNTKL